MASEYYKWLARDVKPREKTELTPAEKRKNWWYYYKKHVIIGIVLGLICIELVCSFFGVGKVKPDYTLAYVGTTSLPDEQLTELKDALAVLGKDENGDGEIVIAVNQYVSYNTGDSDSVYYAQAAQTQLIADITGCDSYFFLLENPAQFQFDTHALRRLDGTLPPDDDYSIEGTCISAAEIPALAEIFTDRELYMGRRGFWTEKTTDYVEGCDALWASLTD